MGVNAKRSRMNDCCRETLGTETGTCVFGCCAVVDRDTGFCPSCKEHSANAVECECGAQFEKWDGEWQRASEEAPK